eukprot:Awhi_evm1s3519
MPFILLEAFVGKPFNPIDNKQRSSNFDTYTIGNISAVTTDHDQREKDNNEIEEAEDEETSTEGENGEEGVDDDILLWAGLQDQILVIDREFRLIQNFRLLQKTDYNEECEQKCDEECDEECAKECAKECEEECDKECDEEYTSAKECDGFTRLLFALCRLGMLDEIDFCVENLLIFVNDTANINITFEHNNERGSFTHFDHFKHLDN